MTNRVYVQDLVAKTLGLFMTHDMCIGQTPPGSAFARLPESVTNLLGGKNQKRLLKPFGTEGVKYRSPDDVKVGLDRWRDKWAKSDDPRGWAFHLIEGQGRLNRIRVSELLTGRQLSAELSLLSRDHTYMNGPSSSATLPNESLKLEVGGLSRALGGGEDIGELLSFFNGCRMTDKSRHLERMGIEAAAEISSKSERAPDKEAFNKRFLSKGFTDQHSDQTFVTPATDKFVLRLACAFGFGRGDIYETLDDKGFERMTVAAWDDGWSSSGDEARSEIWTLFAGQQQDDSRYRGGKVNAFLNAYHRFLQTNDFKPVVGKRKPVAKKTNASSDTEPVEGGRLQLSPTDASIAPPLYVALDLEQGSLIRCDLKPGDTDLSGSSFSFSEVVLQCELDESLQWANGSEANRQTIVNRDDATINLSLARKSARALQFKVSSAAAAGLPPAFLFYDGVDLFQVIAPREGQSITARLYARMSDLKGSCATGLPQKESLLERVLDAHRWAEAVGEKAQRWIENPEEPRIVHRQKFEFRRC